MPLTSIDDAAWASPWRSRLVADKALLSLGLVVTALCLPAVPAGLLVLVVATVCLGGPARIPLSTVRTAMGPPVVLLGLSALPVLVSVGPPTPDAWTLLGPLSVSPQSAARALDVVLHGMAGTLAIFVLAMTTPMVDLLTSARALRIPDACLDVAALTYRLVFLLRDTALTVAQAQRARLGDLPARRRGGQAARARLEAVALLTGTTLRRSWERAERLHDGLAGRGYDGALDTLPAPRVRSLAFKGASVAVIAAVWAATWVLTSSGLLP